MSPTRRGVDATLFVAFGRIALVVTPPPRLAAAPDRADHDERGRRGEDG